MRTVGGKKYKQQGVVLVMALIMLLLVTLIGVASVRATVANTQTSGNSMFSLMVFQGAESTLAKISSIDDGAMYNLKEAAARTLVPKAVDPLYLSTEKVNDDGSTSANNGPSLTASGTIVYERVSEIYSSSATSSKVKYQVFRTLARSGLDSTGARAVHVQGIAFPIAN